MAAAVQRTAATISFITDFSRNEQKDVLAA